ncbi:MAG: integrase core domain-containing protein [bacterium]
MKTKQKVKKAAVDQGKKGMSPPKGGLGGPVGHAGWFTFEQRRKAVRLYLEERIPSELVAKEIGVTKGTVFDWVRLYRERGEAGLHPAYEAVLQRRGNRALTAVQSKIVQVKRANPGFGVKRISQLLRRLFFVPASAETVRRTLHAQQLMPKVKPKPKRNPSKPRFFERSTPNQMWQSDIFPFRLTGQFAYLIGFIDDHSRYITGLELYRTMTAENVLEVYRRATGTYGVPKEMLTDNGRQYTNWRGKTRFEHELQKDRVHHIRSSPHHPMTLGKIERFWKSIWEEFLNRARFETFESARERIAWWVQYYNQQRPHQGLGGLCPADRFFTIQKELGAVMKKGLEENLQELALRGKPKAPFYMVGRMGDQSVVIREEKGKVRMTVDESEGKSVEYDPEGGAHEHDDGEKKQADTAELQRGGESGGGAGGVVGAAADGAGVPGTVGQLGDPAQLGAAGDLGDAHFVGGSAGRGDADAGRRGVGEAAGNAVGGSGRASSDGAGGSGASRTEGVTYPRNVGEVCDEDRADAGLHGSGSVPGGVGGMDRETLGETSLRGTGRQREGVSALAGAGHGRPAQGAPAAGGAGGGTGAGTEPPNEAAAGPQGDGTRRAAPQADETVGERKCYADGDTPGLTGPFAREVNHDEGGGTDGSPGTAPGGTDHPGAGGPADGGGGGRSDGRVAQDLLQVGAAGPLGDPGVVAGREAGPASGPPRSGEGKADQGSGNASEAGAGAGPTPAGENVDAGTGAG